MHGKQEITPELLNAQAHDVKHIISFATLRKYRDPSDIHQDHWSFHLYLSQCHLLHSLHSCKKLYIGKNSKEHMAFPYIKKTRKAAKLYSKKIFFKSALLILTQSTNTFHSTNLFCCFSRYQAPTNSVAPYFCI